MIDDPLLGVLGPLITATRQDSAIQAVIGNDENGIRRVRGFEPAEGDVITGVDVNGRPKFLPFIVFVILDATPDDDVPVTFASIGARCYGSTPQNAWAVYAALVRALHRVGPRVVSGLGIYQTLVRGGQQTTDPDTKQPVVMATIPLLATAQVFAT